jgi:uncharacterized membrane protein YfcA
MSPLLLVIGILIGAVLGLTGAGGSVLAVPLLLICLKLDPASATGLALGVVAASSGYGAIQRIRQREILWIPAALFGISGAIFAPPGRLLASHLPSEWLLGSFSVLSLVIAVRMFLQSIQHPELAKVVRADSGDSTQEPLLCRLSDTGRFDWRVRCMAGLSVGGVLTGLLSGLFGVGGGFLIVPFLNQLNGVSMRHAVATSLVIIAAIASSGFVAHISTHVVDWSQLAQLAHRRHCRHGSRQRARALVGRCALAAGVCHCHRGDGRTGVVSVKTPINIFLARWAI